VTPEVLSHRVTDLEKDVAEMRAENKAQELRLRALEIANAKILGWAAGGAFVGGAFWTLISKFIQ
jgi:hypothetical protein